jgi:hypothetical protein
MNKPFTPKQVAYLDHIYRHTRKHRVKKKLTARLAEGIHEYFMAWLDDIVQHPDLDKVKGFRIIPNPQEMAKRYAKSPYLYDQYAKSHSPHEPDREK